MRISLAPALSIVLLFGPFADGAPPVVTIERPTDASTKVVEVRAVPGRISTLNAEAMGDGIGWFLMPGTDADLIPSPDRKRASFVAPKPGRYPLVVWSGVDAVAIVVVVGTPDPEPVPVPPRPVDPLAERFRAAYLADTSLESAKAKTLADLTELYKQAASFARSADATSVVAVVAKIQAAAKALGIDGLTGVRRAIAEELAVAFPENVDLTDESRLKLATVFGRIHAALAATK